jgi:hypothetical protein
VKFRVIDQHSHDARSPIHIIEQTTGWEVGWINRYLDREYVRRLADTTLRTYAYNLLHFVRWWESIHHTGDIVEAYLTESTLLDYVRTLTISVRQTSSIGTYSLTIRGTGAGVTHSTGATLIIQRGFARLKARQTDQSKAFAMRLRRTFSHVSRSTYAGCVRGGQSMTNPRPACSMADRNVLAVSPVKAARSVGW